MFLLFINDLPDYIRYSKILIYADDVKIFNEIKSPLDASNLQKDLNSLIDWGAANKIQLIISKCKSMHFSRAHSILKFIYKINDVNLVNVNIIKDLGVLVDNKLRFVEHVELTVNKAYRMLGLICRIAKEFNNVETIKYLYSTLVSPILNYASPIWTPHVIYLI